MMRESIYMISLVYLSILLNISNAAHDYGKLQKDLDYIRQKYFQMEESMTSKLKILEDKVKSQDIIIRRLDQENQKQRILTSNQFFEAKKVTFLTRKISSYKNRIRMLEKKLIEQKEWQQIQRESQAAEKAAGDEDSIASVSLKNNSMKGQNGERGVSFIRMSRESRTERLLAPVNPSTNMGNSHAFYAYMGSDMPHPSPHHVFTYDHVVTNVGGNFNQHSGIFTVPEPGVYVLSATTISDVNGIVLFEIVKNSLSFATGFANSASIGNYHTGTLTGVIYAEKDDIIFVRSQTPSAAARSVGSIKSPAFARTSFCGWRVQ